jgi:hypothetical protein
MLNLRPCVLGLCCWLAVLGKVVLAQSNVPPPPAAVADRVGIYAWGFESTGYQAETGGALDRLNWGADKLAQIGSRTIRLTLPGLVYGLPADGDLAQVAASPAYDRLFRDARFKTYLLTTTTTGAFLDTQYPWTDGFTAAEAEATRAEIGRLGDTLLTNPNYAGKTFIIINWEADNELEPYVNKPSIWEAYGAWMQARADGVREARQRHANSAAQLFSAFEFNQVFARSGERCGTPVVDPVRENPLKNSCALDYIAAKVSVDYYSYSFWQTLDVKLEDANASFKARLNRDLSFALAKVREHRPEIEERHFIIGEFGLHRTRWGEKNIANYVAEVIDAVMAPDGFQMSYAVWWQVVDNLPFNIVWEEGFGLFRSRNNLFYLNQVGETFKRKMAGEIVTPLTGGPMLRRSPPGLLNAVTEQYDFQLNPHSRIRLSAEADKPFSATGNRVTVEQMMNTFLLTPDNSPEYTESATQITTVLPQGLRPGGAFIQVLDANGVESQAAFVNLQCAACPQIADVIDSEKQLNEFHPDTVVTISGKGFSTSGNTVSLEQQDVLGQRFRFVIPRADVLQESAEQLRVKLPPDLIFTRFSVVIVANSSGLESNMFALRAFPFAGIVPECPTCAPVLAVQGGVVSRNSTSTDLLPGGEIAISGDRFSTSGNKVIVEQAGQKFELERSGVWSESATQIMAKLPRTVRAGFAILYVVNAQGRESKALSLTIARAAGTVRPPLRREPGNRGILINPAVRALLQSRQGRPENSAAHQRRERLGTFAVPALKVWSVPKLFLSEARERGRKRKAWGVGVAETPGKRYVGSFSP